MPSPVFRKVTMNAITGSVARSWRGGPKRSTLFAPGGRRTWLAVAAVALVGGVVLNWSWLVAAGIAPLLLAFAPCAAMCALGLCMKPGAEGCKRQDAAERPTSAPVPVETGGPGRA